MDIFVGFSATRPTVFILLLFDARANFLLPERAPFYVFFFLSRLTGGFDPGGSFVRA